MSKLISVVVPVYNVEKYLEECLDSVINQTYKNLQIILVDDGSTDKSGIICDEYSHKDPRITVIHQKNMGAGAAKNTGLEYVKGEYLSIIDSDDFIELDMYEKMLSYMKTKKVDVVQCSFNNYFENGRIKRAFRSEKCRVSNFLKDFPLEWKYAVFWNKLFKTELLSGTRFPVGRKIDDEFFTYKLIAKAKYIYNLNEAFYNYRMRKSSVVNEPDNDRLISDRIDCFIDRHRFIGKLHHKLQNVYDEHLSDYLVYCMSQVRDEELKHRIVELQSIYKNKGPKLISKITNRFRVKAKNTISFNGMKYFE